MTALADLAWPPAEAVDEDWLAAGQSDGAWADEPKADGSGSVLAGLGLTRLVTASLSAAAEAEPRTRRGRRHDLERGFRKVRAWPVAPPLAPLLPSGLVRGSTVAVGGSTSLLLALLGAASAAEALIALVGLPRLNADAMAEHGIDLTRAAVIDDAGSRWVRTLGALIDTVDIVVVTPAPGTRVTAGDAQRLAARTRQHHAVLLPYLHDPAAWPGADTRLTAEPGAWEGLGAGHGRLRRRQVTVSAHSRRTDGRSRATTLWLPAADGTATVVEPMATVTALHAARPPARAG